MDDEMPDAAPPIGTSRPRKPWLAALLSLLCTGLGHAYAGSFGRGLVFLVLSALHLPALAWLSLRAQAGWILVAIFVFTVGLVGIWIVAAIDAWYVARGRRRHYALRWCNHALVYVLLVLFQLAYPLTSAFVLRSHFLRAFKTPTRSMAPAVEAGDRILVRLQAYRSAPPERGDVVVFRARNDAGRSVHFVKRVVGLPGERVRVARGRVWIDGRRLTDRVAAGLGTFEDVEVLEGDEERRWRILVDPAEPEAPDAGLEVDVPAGHVFVLGDRRPVSWDSRQIGPVATEAVVGEASYRFAPLSGLGVIE